MISETKKKKVKKNNNKYQRTFRCRDIFLPKINRFFFFLFSDVYWQSTSPPPIRHPPHGHGLKEMPTPLATPRRREPPQPAAKPCRARSLSVWRSPTAKPATWGCRTRSLLVGHGNEFGWSPEFHFAKLSVTVSVGQSQLFGLLKF